MDALNASSRRAVDRRRDEDDDEGDAWAADWWRAEGPMRENDEHLDHLAAGIVQAEHNSDPRDLAFAGYLREIGKRETLSVPGRLAESQQSTPRMRDLSFRHAKTLHRRADAIGKRRAAKPKRSRLGRVWLFGILLMTALLSIRFLPGGAMPHRGDSTALNRVDTFLCEHLGERQLGLAIQPCLQLDNPTEKASLEHGGLPCQRGNDCRNQSLCCLEGRFLLSLI
jgi:hypothetical protein